MASELSKVMRGPEVMSQFESILGAQANSYIATVLITVANSDDLKKCTIPSIIKAATQAATLRLSVDPVTRQAWLVPRYNTKVGAHEANFQIGFKGYYDMAMRTEKYRFINISEFPEGVGVEFDLLTGRPKVIREEGLEGGYFAAFELYKGFYKAVFWTHSDLEAHRMKYAPNNPLWKKHPEKMKEKTVGTDLLKGWGVFNENDQLALNAMEAENEMEDNSHHDHGTYAGEDLLPEEFEPVLDGREWPFETIKVLLDSDVFLDEDSAVSALQFCDVKDVNDTEALKVWGADFMGLIDSSYTPETAGRVANNRYKKRKQEAFERESEETSGRTKDFGKDVLADLCRKGLFENEEQAAYALNLCLFEPGVDLADIVFWAQDFSEAVSKSSELTKSRPDKNSLEVSATIANNKYKNRIKKA